MTRQSRGRWAHWAKVLAPVAASFLGLAALKLLGPHWASQRDIHSWLVPLGKWAPLAFIAFLALRPVTLLPGQFFTAVGGLMFGSVAGTGYALLGHLLASGVIFLLSRRLGKPVLARMMGPRYPALRKAARHHDFRFAILCCINPLLPTDVAQAAAAAAGARFWPVALGTTLGSIPGTYLTAAFGSSLGQGRTVMPLLLAALTVVSLLLGALLGRQMKHEVDEASRTLTPVEGLPRVVTTGKAGPDEPGRFTPPPPASEPAPLP